jgi:MFS family permease
MLNRSLTFFRQFDHNLWILCIGWFVGAMGFAASIPFLSIYFHDQLGMSITEIGVFFGGMALVRSFCQAAGGELSDRMSRTQLLIHSQIIRAVFFVMIALAISWDWGFWWIATFVTLNSVFGAIFMPTINALVADLLPESKRLNGYAITRAAGNLGWAAGPAVGGFLAHSSYSILFHISAAITLVSGLIFWLFFTAPEQTKNRESFRFSDLLAVRKDRHLARHCILILFLYLVVAQLIAPFSVYTVDMVGITEVELGILFAINGVLVAALQVPCTHMLSRQRFTSQLAAGAIMYFIGYGVLGLTSTFASFAAIIAFITIGEVVMSPPSLTLTSKLAPEGRMGRYMGVFGFFMTAGWSLGPLYGGFFLDHFGDNPAAAWLMISSLALLSGLGYIWYGRVLPDKYNRND